MEKNNSLLNELHRIDISGAVNPAFMQGSNSEQNASQPLPQPLPQSLSQPPQPQPQPQPAVSKPLSEAMQRRVTDFRLSRRDLAVRIAESLAGIDHAIVDSERALQVLKPRREHLASIAAELNKESPLDVDGVATQSQIAAESRRLEELRLEACRMIAESGATTQSIPIQPQKSSTSSFDAIDWGSVTFGQLCRIGWGIFFPVIVSVILASLLIGAALIAAFNGTIRW
ncbi:MAG: hypothetical protein IKO02_05825 [Lentisphaeria bacterium]|nr:hypothetical protein [Lentisphaeria bacterium]